MTLRYKKTAIIILAVFLLIADRFLKSLILYLGPGFQQRLIDDFLLYRLAMNPNIAFSLPLASDYLKFIILIIILGILFHWLANWKKLSFAEWSLFLFVLVGASSNLFDRFRYGSVVDYLDLKYFSVFNLADAVLTIACLTLIAMALFQRKRQA